MNDTLIDALNGKTHSYVPVWYMRQAGRHMPGFAKYISDVGLSKVIRNPRIASEIAAEAVEKLNVDAAIMFSDLITPIEEAGLEYSYEAGPHLKSTFSLNKFEDAANGISVDDLWFIRDQIMEVRNMVDVPVIGFAGAPFTMASYVIEGMYVREFPKTKLYMISGNWNRLMDAMLNIIVKDIDVQMGAGASAVQLFDTWIGVLSEDQFKKYYYPILSKLISHIRNKVPVIYFCTDCNHLLKIIGNKVKPTALSVDWKTSLRLMHKITKTGLQGNLDPVYALAGGDTMLREAAAVLKDADRINNYVFNLGHGVLPGTDWRELKNLTEYVHKAGQIV